MEWKLIKKKKRKKEEEEDGVSNKTFQGSFRYRPTILIFWNSKQ